MAFRKRDYLHWLLGVILCTLAIVIWVVMDARESALRDARIQEEATNHMDYIQTDMRTKLPALQNIANEWNAQAGLGKEVFEKQVMQILREMSGFQAIALADQNNYIRWVFPELENELLLNLDLTFEERRRIALELAKRRKAVSMTDPVELISGGAGVIVFIPLQKKDVFDGFIVAVFRIEDWLDNVFSQYSTGKQRAHFRIAVQIDAVPVYTQESFNEDGVAALAHVVEAPLNGHQIRVICRPTKLFVDTSSNKVNEAVGVGGVLLAILITLLIHFWLRTKEFMSKPSLAKLLAEESKSFAASHANQESTPGNGDAPTLSTARDTFHIEELQSQINDLEKQNQEIPMLQQRLAGVTLSLALATRAGRVGVWILDLATNSCKWNEMMNELHNCKTGEVQGQDAWLQLIHPEDKGEFEKALANAIETNRMLNICFRVVLKDGTEKTMRAMGRVETNADKKPVRVIGVSVQEKVAAEAIGQPVDALTGLPALHVAKDRAGMAMNLAYRNQKQVAFLFLDLDDFGHLVQREGEETGNGLLVGIAKRLTEMVRSSDTVTRVEKDRFLIILLDVQGAVDAGKVAEKIIKDLALPVPVDNKMLRTSASIGIALFPDNATEPDELIAQAKKAMEQVKKNGKNAHSFANEL